MDENQNINFSKNHANRIVGFLDIVGSTNITANLTNEEIDDFYTIFLNQIYWAVKSGEFQIIKNMGDGILFYFPKDFDIEQISSIKSSLNEILIARENINLELTAKNLPCIDFRISLSFGPISATLNVSNKIIDIFGATINTCVKINKLARPNTIVAGEAMKKILNDHFIFNKIADYYINKELSFGVYELHSK